MSKISLFGIDRYEYTWIGKELNIGKAKAKQRLLNSNHHSMNQIPVTD